MATVKNGQKVKEVYYQNSKIKFIYCGSSRVYRLLYLKTFSQVYTSSNSITFPSTAFDIQVTIVGAGGCAGNYSSGAAGKPTSYYSIGGAGGGAGGYSFKNYGDTIAGNTVSFTVGQCGSSACASGGASSFKSQIAYGGGGGGQSSGGWNVSQSAAGGTGGTASGGDTNYQGGSGGRGTGAAYTYVITYGQGGAGWTVNGVAYGRGATPNAISDSAATVTNNIRPGCVFIKYQYYD